MAESAGCGEKKAWLAIGDIWMAKKKGKTGVRDRGARAVDLFCGCGVRGLG